MFEFEIDAGLPKDVAGKIRSVVAEVLRDAPIRNEITKVSVRQDTNWQGEPSIAVFLFLVDANSDWSSRAHELNAVSHQIAMQLIPHLGSLGFPLVRYKQAA